MKNMDVKTCKLEKKTFINNKENNCDKLMWQLQGYKCMYGFIKCNRSFKNAKIKCLNSKLEKKTILFVIKCKEKKKHPYCLV